MKLTPATFAGARRAFGLTTLPVAEASRRVLLHGRLAQEALAFLVLRDEVLLDEPALRARLSAQAQSCHAAARTLREKTADVGAAREQASITAVALGEIVALDAPLLVAERAHALTPLGSGTHPSSAATRSPAQTASRRIEALMDALLPAPPP
ncbi:MAG: hypothetical protein AAF160_11755 [Pseudomonadota bacterium]